MITLSYLNHYLNVEKEMRSYAILYQVKNYQTNLARISFSISLFHVTLI